MTLPARRVLDLFLGVVGFGNAIYITQAQIASELDLSRSAVSRAVKLLRDLDLIYEASDKRGGHWQLNASFAFKGHGDHHKVAAAIQRGEGAGPGELEEDVEVLVS